MGIYSDGNVYGVSWELRYVDYKMNLKYEKTFTSKLNLDQIQEIKNDFEKLSEEERSECFISFYTSVTDTYGSSGSYMTWFPGDKAYLELLFEKGDIPI